MYQIYNQPTKFPLSQGQVVRKYRNQHDKMLKKTIARTHSAIDSSNPTHFPLRFSTHSRRETEKDIKRENKRIVNSLLRAKSDSTLRSVQKNKNESKKREKFFDQHRRRKWINRKSEIEKQNCEMYKRIKNIRSSVIIDKNDKQRRKRYLQNRKRSRANDIFAIPQKRRSLQQKESIKLPPINQKNNNDPQINKENDIKLSQNIDKKTIN